MTTSAFPPATPLLDAMARIRQRVSTLTMDDLRRFLDQALVVLAFIGGVLIALAKRSHQLLKGLIILMRVGADLLDRFDNWIEYMIAANSSRPQPEPEPTRAPTPALPIASAPATEAASNTPKPRTTRRRTKRATTGLTSITA